MTQFIFDGYEFDSSTGEAKFHYTFDDGRAFTEIFHFEVNGSYNVDALSRALYLAHILIGASYYKTFPTPNVAIETGGLDPWQTEFFNHVYQEGMSQYAFENQLTRDDLAHFLTSTETSAYPVEYHGRGTLALQSGGKDSLLVAALLRRAEKPFTPLYMTSSEHHPAVLDELGNPLVIVRRVLDKEGLTHALQNGAKNGHVPITYIVQSVALIQTILSNKNEILVSIAHEGEEAHETIGDLEVSHQWSKTWQAEQLFSEYVTRYISKDIHIGSPLRRFSELRVAELFIQHAWGQFGHRFSSCNLANYKQGENNSELLWCGECPKCANSYLLFAPFLDAPVLQQLFGGQDLFQKEILQETFKGLLGIDGVMKPFECVGEIDELRYAYRLAQEKGGYGHVSFDVPHVEFDYLAEYPAQEWAQLPL